MDPARTFKESLTSRPELENSQGQIRKSRRATGQSAFPSRTDVVSRACQVRKVPILLQKSVETGREA